MKIVAATNNKGKLKEINAILGGLGYEVVSLNQIGIEIDVEETGTTFEENALLKARAVAALTNFAVIADDSGLCVDVLGGEPGVYSARYAGEGASDDMLIAKLLGNMQGIEREKRGAYFVSVVALVMPDKTELVAEGKAYGYITTEPDGEGGFGYDPVFCSDEIGKTYARMSSEEKNSISHRGRALMKMKDMLTQM
ncbi:MAG: XTP/dITP diphosphatase [Ruminococcaceae bacterium]|nr:XTP/dITP diphosphatase [Oscillospiraceae bacterium]